VTNPPWSIYTVLVALLCGYILVPLLIANVVLLVQPWLSPIDQLLIQQAVTLLTWVIILIILGWRFGWATTLDRLGLNFKKKWTYYGLETLRLMIVTTSLTLTFNYLWLYLSRTYPKWSPGAEPYSQYEMPELLALTIFAVMMAPLLEEVIFRGFVQSAMHRSFTPARSVLVTCLVFLLFHGSYFTNIKAISHVVVLGLCLGIWRERTGSLIPGMSVHLLNNVLASSILLFH
jgi:membrane protease YdiL (CAAX protease family)